MLAHAGQTIVHVDQNLCVVADCTLWTEDFESALFKTCLCPCLAQVHFAVGFVCLSMPQHTDLLRQT